MAVARNENGDINVCKILEYCENEVNVCHKLDKPSGGEVFVCRNTEAGKPYRCTTHVDVDGPTP